MMHRDEAHNLDPESNLIGICSLPTRQLDSEAPCVIFINAGLLHRVGPNRMNTTLARELAGRGFASIRIDISGLGDSMTGDHIVDNNEMVAQDLDKAMNFMTRQYAFKRFILIGLCSGAYDTFRKAQQDTRVVGLLNMDGTGYRTRRFLVNHVFIHLLRRAFDPQRWLRLWRRYEEHYRSRSFAGHSGRPSQRAGVMTVLAFTDMTREQSGEAIAELAERGVKMHFLFTGGVSGYYNYHKQFDDIFHDFEFSSAVTHSYFPVTDHLSMLQHHRDEVYAQIVDWVHNNFDTRSDHSERQSGSSLSAAG